MKPSNTLTVLSSLIVVLALVAAGAGLVYQGEGASFEFTSLRGETVEMYGHGLYRYEPVLAAAQAIPQDVVTLVVAIPLLLVALRLYHQGRVRGQLLLAGTLGYFLYTYTSMAFGASFNPLFLVYVALFSLSLFAFIMAMVTVDLATLPSHFTEKLPRRGIAAFMFASAGFLVLMWLGRIVPALLTGAPPVGLESNTTLFIQVMDLGLVVPLMVLAGVLLLRRHPLGYLLAAVGQLKFATFGIALVAMIIGQWLAGVPMTAAEVVIFPILAGIAILMAFLLLRDLREDAPTRPEAVSPARHRVVTS
jgi:hypothetical protein